MKNEVTFYTFSKNLMAFGFSTKYASIIWDAEKSQPVYRTADEAAELR